jgi:hypothetical protein
MIDFESPLTGMFIACFSSQDKELSLLCAIAASRHPPTMPRASSAQSLKGFEIVDLASGYKGLADVVGGFEQMKK